jgi:hypothetical protein
MPASAGTVTDTFTSRHPPRAIVNSSGWMTVGQPEVVRVMVMVSATLDVFVTRNV